MAMDDITDIRAVLRQFTRPDAPGLFTMIVQRLRAAQTMFDDRVKLVLVQEDDEQFSALKMPYLLVIPTVERPRLTVPDQDMTEIIVPRHIAMVGQFDAGATDLANGAGWGAADQIDNARTQLMLSLINW